MRRSVLLVVTLALVPAIHVLEGGLMSQLAQPAAALLAVVMPVVVAGVWYRGGLSRALQAGWSLEPLEPAAALGEIEVLQSLRKLCVAGAALALLQGLMHVLGHLADPSKLGAGVAIAWVAAFYLVCCTELCLAPLIRQVAIRGLLTSAGEPSASGPSTGGPAAGQRAITLVVVGGVTVFSLVGAWVFEGGGVSAVLLPAAPALVGLSLLFGAAWHGGGALKQALWGCPATSDASAGELQRCRQVLLSLRTLAYGLAAAGYVIGHIHVMANLDDPAELGAGLAMATCVWLFALILAELMVGPRLQRFQTELALGGGQDDRLARAANTGPAPVLMLVASVLMMVTLVLWALGNIP